MIKKTAKFIGINNCYIFVLIIIVLLVYFPTFFNDFIYMWDDQWQVLTKTTENGFNWGNIVQIFSQSFYSQYFPVNQFFYMLVYVLSGGYNAFAFHLFCLFVHALNTILVYYLIKKCLLLSERVDGSKVKIMPFLTALLFAVHPLNVESVAWISASKVLIYSFFFLLALYAYVIYYKKNRYSICYTL